MWQNFKQLLWKWRGVWITAPSVTATVIALRLCGWLQPWEQTTLDQYFRWRPPEPIDDRIVIVGIDEADLKKAKQWPISDSQLAQLLKQIKAQQPRAIGLDLYRDFPVEPGHAELVEVFNNTPNLIGIELINEEDSSAAVAPPPVLEELGQVGLNNVSEDGDGKLRRGYLYRLKGDQILPSLSLFLADLYLQEQDIFPEPTEADPQVFRWGKAVFRPLKSNEGGYANVDNGDYQILLNYRGPAGSFTTVSMSEVLEEKIPTELMRDRIVLIGATASSLNDFLYTPYSSTHITTPERTAGVEVHANIISHILSAVLEGRPTIKTWPEAAEWLWILLWSGIGATLTWQLRYSEGVKSFSWRKSSSLLIAGFVLLGSTYVAFLSGWWLPVFPPFIALVGSAAAITTYLAHNASEVRKIFGRYLTDQVVASLLESPQGLELGGQNQKITILTSDLRGFTALSERLSPNEVVKILNLYLGYMTDVITSFQGTIDEFMGDGILVLFGAPTPRANDSSRAIACAVAMQLAMVEVNQKMQERGLPQLEMGIGINTGEVVVGNIGSEKRTKYSVIGSQVNLTFRIESYTTGGQILISESTYQEVGQSLQIDGHKQVKPKGVKELINIYEVGGIREEYNLFLPKQEELFLPLPEAISIQYAILDGKHVSDSLLQGSIVQLSLKGAQVHSPNLEEEHTPEPLSNIKLNLLTPNNPIEANLDIYAKVLAKPAEPGSFYLRFTAQPTEVKARLESIYKRAESLSQSVQPTLTMENQPNGNSA
ncbi:MAG: adenylate/guanylate cyclase domain-containing protein [Symploca sp. SIO1B1]|nr:adenylate/guanylate cyclase domain-containing protein [Symploca sp. SIO1C2]NER92731.1 adenylate/guanylate cyclase domain-containing protein [Symploca sp. SIO1B1]